MLEPRTIMFPLLITKIQAFLKSTVWALLMSPAKTYIIFLIKLQEPVVIIRMPFAHPATNIAEPKLSPQSYLSL